MSLYSTLASLSQTAASNAADGSVDAPSTVDQQLNLLASFCAQLRDGTNFPTYDKHFDGGTLFNASLSVSLAANAMTIALKTAAGSDASSTDPIYVTFRSGTGATGTVTVRSVTAALSITIPSTVTLGSSNATLTRFWVGLVDMTSGSDDVQLVVTNCKTATGIVPVNESNTLTGIAVGSLSASGAWGRGAGIFTAKPFRIAGFVEHTQATAGTYVTTPSKIQPFFPGMHLPGDAVQAHVKTLSTSATGTTQTPLDNTIPQVSEGDEYLTVDITAGSGANDMQFEIDLSVGHSVANTVVTASLHKDAGAAIAAGCATPGATSSVARATFVHRQTAATGTYSVRAGGSAAGTTTVNGAGGSQLLGGVLNSTLKITEIMG